jgi:hypothetical protein
VAMHGCRGASRLICIDQLEEVEIRSIDQPSHAPSSRHLRRRSSWITFTQEWDSLLNILHKQKRTFSARLVELESLPDVEDQMGDYPFSE